jgi:hypothetical protein
MSAGVIRLMYAGREASENSGSPEGSCLMRNHETDSVGARTGEEPTCSQAGGVGARDGKFNRIDLRMQG